MFRKIYHQANDEIPCNKELLEKIINSKKKKNKYRYPLAVVAASVCIVCASIMAYPSLQEGFEENPVPTPIVTEPVQTPIVPTPTPKATNATKTNTPKPKKTKEPIANTPAPTEKIVPTAEPDVQNTEPEEIVEKEGRVKGVTSDAVENESFRVENWTREKYFEYLGKEVSPKLPEDLEEKSLSDKQMTVYKDSGVPYYDVWTLKYASQDGEREVSIKLTKNIKESYQQEVLENYREFAKDGISFEIESKGLSKEEFESLCESL